MINPPPEERSSGRVNALEVALKRDAIVQAIWSVGGVAKRLERWLAAQVFTTLTVGTLTATDIDTGSLDATGAITTDTLEATTSIETVDLVVTGTATLPGGGGVTYPVSASAQALNTNGDLITIPAGIVVRRVTTSGGITGILLTDGSDDGQLLIILNESATTFTYASGEVHAAATFVHPSETALFLIWNAATGRWHRNAT